MYKLYRVKTTKNVKIYVNGIAINQDWNNYATLEDALDDINKLNIEKCNPLIDDVEVREEQTLSYMVDR